MIRARVILNIIAAMFVIAWGIEQFLLPHAAVLLYTSEYKKNMFNCDHVMREHFIAKQMVLAEVNDITITNLEAAEVGLSACHSYDKLRKKMLSWGVTENKLSSIGLTAIEDKAGEVRQFVETHEIRY